MQRRPLTADGLAVTTAPSAVLAFRVTFMLMFLHQSSEGLLSRGGGQGLFVLVHHSLT